MRAFAAIAVGFVVAGLAASAGLQNRHLVDQGRETYELHCATCHGLSGVGDGILAVSVRKRPKDLTRLARDTDGKFPIEKVIKAIEGIERPIGSDMPAWGELFAKMHGSPTARDAQARIAAVAAYLESIQARR